MTLLLQQASLLSFSWLLVPKPILIVLTLPLGFLLDFIELLPQLPVLISTGHVIILMIFLGVFDVRGLDSHDHAAPLVHQFLCDTHNFGNTSFLARVCLDSFAEDPGAFQVFGLNLQVIEAGEDLLNYHLIGISPVGQRLDPLAHHLAPSTIQEVVLDCNPAQLFRHFFKEHQLFEGWLSVQIVFVILPHCILHLDYERLGCPLKLFIRHFLLLPLLPSHCFLGWKARHMRRELRPIVTQYFFLVLILFLCVAFPISFAILIEFTLKLAHFGLQLSD